MGIKKKHVPGCGCCGASVPPIWACCPGGQPTTGYQAVITGFTGNSCAFSVFSGGIWIGIDYFDCAELNGTRNFANPPAGDCQWESAFSNVTGHYEDQTLLLTVEWRLSMYPVGSDKYIRIYAQIANQTNPDPVLLLDAASLENTACASISGKVIELSADALQPGSECCGVGAATEAAITAV